MKAAVIDQVGPPEAIVVRELPDPVAGPGEVLVRVRAAAVNPIDTYVRAGSVAMPLPFPFIVGWDLAGEVVAVTTGPFHFGLRIGERYVDPTRLLLVGHLRASLIAPGVPVPKVSLCPEAAGVFPGARR